MWKRDKMSFEEHEQVSAWLRELEKLTWEVCTYLGGKVPVGILDRMTKIHNELHAIKMKMEDVMERDLKGDRRLSTDVYFPRDPDEILRMKKRAESYAAGTTRQ